jgi:NAD(P) transhydrogenase subunit beta
MFSTIVGAISFWGSNVAFLKLQEWITGKPVKLPGQQIINGLLLIASIAGAIYLCTGEDSEAVFVAVLVMASLLGVLVVLPIGGADMPVVISMLNAFTGLAAAAAGFTLDNTALIVAGTLVGASGTILTKLMGEAMNRSLGNVLFAGFGSAPSGGGEIESAEGKTHRSTSADDVAIQLAYASKVVIVPGYGMAVAQAQHAVRELTDELEKRGVDVDFAIHPVAGRMPGHMNVLLAEADVSYDKLKEMDEINPEFPQTDVSLVIGANDVTNPAARSNESSPIYGMPILDVDKSQAVIVLKRSMNPGFAGIDNELYYEENTQMLFGDAKKSISDVLGEVKELG